MKYVVITGVSSGIGYVTTKYLIEHQYHVFGTVRSAEDAANCQNAFGDSFTPLLLDVRDINAIQRAAKFVEKTLKGQNLSALVNNAGIAISGPLQFIPSQDIQNQFDINVVGLVNMTQAFLPLLGGKQDNVNNPGRIVNISSVAGTFTMPFQTPYAASKHAVESLTDGMRRELMPYGIHVISIRPGPIKSDIWFKELAKDNKQYDKTIYRNVWRKKNELISKKELNAAPTIEVSIAILKSIEARKPRNYVLVYNQKLTYYLIRMLPTSWVDVLMRRQLKKMMT